jgi:hypothetical protein
MNRLQELLEQLRDTYCNRHTFETDEEWLENIDAIMKEIYDLPDTPAMDFNPQAYKQSLRNARHIVGSWAYQKEHP